jgi:hypothetical protein
MKDPRQASFNAKAASRIHEESFALSMQPLKQKPGIAKPYRRCAASAAASRHARLDESVSRCEHGRRYTRDWTANGSLQDAVQRRLIHRCREQARMQNDGKSRDIHKTRSAEFRAAVGCKTNADDDLPGLNKIGVCGQEIEIVAVPQTRFRVQRLSRCKALNHDMRYGSAVELFDDPARYVTAERMALAFADVGQFQERPQSLIRRKAIASHGPEKQR